MAKTVTPEGLELASGYRSLSDRPMSQMGLVSRASPVQTACATVREMKEGPSGSALGS